MAFKEFPPVPEVVLRQLKERYPDKLPQGLVTKQAAARLIGQQDVIRFLQTQFDKQNN